MYISRGHRLEFRSYDVLRSLDIVFILANSKDPDEMPQNVAFHLCLHCLPKNMSIGDIKYTNVQVKR